MNPAAIQRVIRQRYWLTGAEMAALLGLAGPPAGGQPLPWRGHVLQPVSRTPDGRLLWQLTPGQPARSTGLQRLPGAAAAELSRWTALLPGGLSAPVELPPLLFRAVIGWLSPLLPGWLQLAGWPAAGTVTIELVAGPAPTLAAAGWPDRPTGAEASLAMAIALADGADWLCGETGERLPVPAGDVVLADAPPHDVACGGLAPLWLAGWVRRGGPTADA